jgi:predicted  nucleic acid-binding Zn-ribbon protein
MRAPHRFVALCVILLAFGCERRKLQERLTVLEQERASLTQRLDQHKNSLRDATLRVDTLNSELTTYNTDIHSFVAAHRIAAECIRASRSTWGDNSTFSHDVSATTRLGSALCSVGLLNAQFAQEVTRVAEKLGEADAHVRQLKEQIAAGERELAAERAEVAKSEAVVGDIAAEIVDVQRQLDR